MSRINYLSAVVESTHDTESHSDVVAVSQWLHARGHRSRNTFEAYKREAEKLLGWAYNRGQTLSALKAEDINQYLCFLAAAGDVKPSTVRYSRTVINQMYQYLCDMGHITTNAVKLTPILSVPVEDEITKFLDLDAWIWLWKWLTSRPVKKERELVIKSRDRWLFALIYHTGMRREEVAKASMADFRYHSNRWALRVVGKRNKIRHVTINSILLHELQLYRQDMGLSPLPSHSENYGVIIPLKGNKHRRLTPRAIGLMVHDCREKVMLDCDDDHIRIQIADMSTHWLRHTNTTHRYLAGAATETIQDEQGHADPKTTRTYLKTLATQRQQDAEKLAMLHNQALDE